MTKITLGLDVDGVLLDYVSGFFEYLPSIGIIPACKPAQVDNFDFRCAFPDLDRTEIKRLIGEFSVTEGFGRLPPYPGAVEGIAEIKAEYGDDMRIVAITSAGTSAETRRLREQNLELFPFDEINVLDLGSDKSEQLSKLGKNAVFVDDLLVNVQAAEKLGIGGILYRQLYNAMDHHPETMTDWAGESLQVLKGNIIDRCIIGGEKRVA